MFCRLHVEYILYYKHYQAYLKYLRVCPSDTRPIYFRFNKTESILVIYLIREPLPLFGNETDSSVVWRIGPVFEGDQSVIGWGLEAIAAYAYTHIMKAAIYSVCMDFVYVSAFHVHILPNSCCIHWCIIPNIEKFHFMHERNRETAYTISRLCQVRSNYPSTLSDRRDTLYLLHQPAETEPPSV